MSTPRPSRNGQRARKRPAEKPIGIVAMPLKRSTVKATEAKNLFGVMLRRAKAREPIFIEKHNTVEAVLIGYDTYRSLVQRARTSHEVSLDELRQEFDALYSEMQSVRSRRSVDALLSASAEDLNRTAAVRAKTRG